MQKFYWNRAESNQNIYDYGRYSKAPYPDEGYQVTDRCNESMVSNNSSAHFGPITVTVNTGKEEPLVTNIPVTAAGSDIQYHMPQHARIQQQPVGGSHRVLLRLRNQGDRLSPISRHSDTVTSIDSAGSDIYSSPTNPPVHVRLKEHQRNKTWNQNSLSTAAQHRLGIQCNEKVSGKRLSVRNIDYFGSHNYENVYDNNSPSSTNSQSTSDSSNSVLDEHEDMPVSDSKHNGIRSRKKGRHVKQLYRSKSCDRAGVREVVLDSLKQSSDRIQTNICRLSDKLTSLGIPHMANGTGDGECPPPPPATPTPSIFQSFASRTIPCVTELKSQCVAASGRISPAESEAYTSAYHQEVSRPAQSLAYRMRGKLESVNKKMNLIRSRSAERLRGVTGGGLRSSEMIPVSSTARLARSGTRAQDDLGYDGEVEYTGPFLGQARAVVDYIPSPYDRDALRFCKDDIIDIIAMNASGLWRGRYGGKVGNFKFVNVEILPPTRERRRSRSRSLRRLKRKPKTISEVMHVLRMEEHTPVFVLNGYENLTLFKDLDDAELDYLGITDPKHREKLIAMAELLYPLEKTNRDIDDVSDNFCSFFIYHFM